MGKTAFIFPGQGAQKQGMAKSFTEAFKSSSEIFDIASESTGIDMRDLIFNQDESVLGITENTQPAILTASVAALLPLLENGIKPDYTAGLSLGEYTAHVCSGTMTFADAVALVKKRGKYMQEAVPVGVGGMAAILGMDDAAVEAICMDASKTGIVSPANYNCPGQIVIAGEIPAVQAAMDAALKAGASRAIMLPVSAPFHCSMLKPAGDKLEAEFRNVTLGKMNVPVLTNVTGKLVASESEVKDLLVRQVSSPVRWESCIRQMIADGVDTFIEIGPGKALTGFLRKIDKERKAYNIEDADSLKDTLEKLAQG